MPEPVQEPSRDAGDAPEPSHRADDRYEPLPGLAQLPRWVWRRLPTAGRIALAAVPVAILALVLLLGPGIERSKEERERGQAEMQAERQAEQIARLRTEQRPRFGSGVAAGSDLTQRGSLLGEARRAVGEDARARVSAGLLAGPVRRVTCEPYPRTVDGAGAHLEPDKRSGTYACLALTREVAAGERSEAALIGHPYRLRIDFVGGRYALCKVAGRAGEGSLGAAPLVTVPRACSGD